MCRLIRLLAVCILPLVLLACSRQPHAHLPDLERRVSDVLRLHTYEHVYRDIVYFGEERSFLFFKTMDRRLLFSVDIVVEAGIDLAEGLELAHDEQHPRRLIVELPPTRILLVDADESSINQYFSRERGGDVGWLEYSSQIDEVKTRVEADAVERGILEKAQTSAREVVTDFFELSGFEEVVFRAPETPSSRTEDLRG
ncbi:MAG: DUF4230 domain-containing protein [Spirochaetota bacterium]